MRKLRKLPKPNVIRRTTTRETNVGKIEAEFEQEYQAFIQELRNKKDKDEKVTETETTQDIQSDKQ
jgi:hypothetical protein